MTTTEITLEGIKRETDKAILAKVEIETCAGRCGKEIWFPKSQTTVADNKLIVPAWLAKKKLDEFRVDSFDSWFN